MADYEKTPTSDRQLLAERKYAALKRAVEEAGFFVPQVIGDQHGDRLFCTSKFPKGYGYTGRIAVVTEAGGSWYLATPHPYHYRVIDPTQVERAVTAFLGPWPKREYQLDADVSEVHRELEPISDEEFEKAVRRQ
jgi:hypothetical protein